MDVFTGENRARGLRYQATLAEIGGQNQAAADIYQGQVAESNAKGAAFGSILGGLGGIANSFGRRNSAKGQDAEDDELVNDSSLFGVQF
jgi:hypothetical protein